MSPRPGQRPPFLIFPLVRGKLAQSLVRRFLVHAKT